MNSRLGSRFEDFYLLNKLHLQTATNLHQLLCCLTSVDGKGEGSKEEEEKEGKNVGGSQVCLPGRWRKKEGEEKGPNHSTLYVHQSFIGCLPFYVFLRHRCPVYVLAGRAWEERSTCRVSSFARIVYLPNYTVEGYPLLSPPPPLYLCSFLLK